MVLNKRVDCRQKDYLNFNKRVGPNKTVLVGKKSNKRAALFFL